MIKSFPFLVQMKYVRIYAPFAFRSSHAKEWGSQSFIYSNDTLVKFEELFYNEYPQYKEHNTYLTINGNSVKGFKTIEENGIKQGNVIIVDAFD